MSIFTKEQIELLRESIPKIINEEKTSNQILASLFELRFMNWCNVFQLSCKHCVLDAKIKLLIENIMTLSRRILLHNDPHLKTRNGESFAYLAFKFSPAMFGTSSNREFTDLDLALASWVNWRHYYDASKRE